MKRYKSAYWWCQIGGWLFYGLALMFFAFAFEQEIKLLFAQRLFLSVVFGFLFTHIFRELLHWTNLLPPLVREQWLKLLIGVVSLCIVYSLTNSSVVEWLGWYNIKMKVTLRERFFYNLFNDSPIILVWVSIYFIWHYMESGRKSLVDKVKLESLVKELELRTIKSHINPHFIFNALNSIRALVDENPERARTAITELSNILRSSMQTEKAETTSLERELNIVKDYLALEHIRFEDRLRIEYDIDEDTLDQPVPPMMLQTLVENAIKHGIGKQKEGGLIKVISDFKDDHHELIVQNTGKLTGSYNDDGFGIASTQNRLLLLFGKKASFELKDINGNMVEAKVIMPVSI
jgi:sensor histidine kinase YesM